MVTPGPLSAELNATWSLAFIAVSVKVNPGLPPLEKKGADAKVTPRRSAGRRHTGLRDQLQRAGLPVQMPVSPVLSFAWNPRWPASLIKGELKVVPPKLLKVTPEALPGA